MFCGESVGLEIPFSFLQETPLAEGVTAARTATEVDWPGIAGVSHADTYFGVYPLHDAILDHAFRGAGKQAIVHLEGVRPFVNPHERVKHLFAAEGDVNYVFGGNPAAGRRHGGGQLVSVPHKTDGSPFSLESRQCRGIDIGEFHGDGLWREPLRRWRWRAAGD